jgi:hypothetical protein
VFVRVCVCPHVSWAVRRLTVKTPAGCPPLLRGQPCLCLRPPLHRHAAAARLQTRPARGSGRRRTAARRMWEGSRAAWSSVRTGRSCVDRFCWLRVPLSPAGHQLRLYGPPGGGLHAPVCTPPLNLFPRQPPLLPSHRGNPAGSARSAARRFAAAFAGDGEFDAEEAALSNVDAREAARRAADPLSALDIPSLGALRLCRLEGGCWVAVGGVKVCWAGFGCARAALGESSASSGVVSERHA